MAPLGGPGSYDLFVASFVHGIQGARYRAYGIDVIVQITMMIMVMTIAGGGHIRRAEKTRVRAVVWWLSNHHGAYLPTPSSRGASWLSSQEPSFELASDSSDAQLEGWKSVPHDPIA
jgi:hypothetical protein